MKIPKLFRIASVIPALAICGCEKQDEQREQLSESTTQPEQAQEVTPHFAELYEEAKKPMTDTSEAPEDGYFRGYLWVREAEKANDKEQSILGLQKALESFQSVKDRYPEWKSSMVGNRIQLTTQSIAQLQQLELHKFNRIEESINVWIYSDTAMIALDVIHYPSYSHLPDKDQAHFYSLLNDRIRKLLRENNQNFMFLKTDGSLSGFGQTCGLVYLKDGTTLQEVLIREGFARFDRRWKDSGRFAPEGAIARIEAVEKRLLAADNEAKKGMRGYWSIGSFGAPGELPD
jgi:endonuclease YncB( thermonuclease family)